jgi:hypothetical protein
MRVEFEFVCSKKAIFVFLTENLKKSLNLFSTINSLYSKSKWLNIINNINENNINIFFHKLLIF